MYIKMLLSSRGIYFSSIFSFGLTLGIFITSIYYNGQGQQFLQNENTTLLDDSFSAVLSSENPLTQHLTDALNKTTFGHSDLQQMIHSGNEAEQLVSNIRILCMVLTSPDNHQLKAIHVKRTWGQRCTVLIFITTLEDPDLSPVILLEGHQETHQNLWRKTVKGFTKAYEHYANEVDWFFKADDDTYVIMENLRLMLSKYNPEEDHYIGAVFNPSFIRHEYMSGGAGYIMSKSTMRKLVENTFRWNNDSCLSDDAVPKRGGELHEDLELGRCINSLNISADDSRDIEGKMRFFPFPPDTHVSPEINQTGYEWFWHYNKYTHQEGLECCSDFAVSFHYVAPDKMYLYEYFLYHLHPFGYKQHASHSSLRPSSL